MEAVVLRNDDSTSTPPSNAQTGNYGRHEHDTRAVYDILSFFAQEFRKTRGEPNYPTQKSPRSSNWVPTGTDPYGAYSSQPNHSRKRRRLDSCGNAYEELDISNEELEDMSAHLPSPAILETIVTVYFSIIQPWIPILHETRFRKQLNDPEQRSHLVVILHAMVVATMRFLEEDGITLDEVTHRCNRSRNIVVLTAMDNLSVENLQALTIIAFDDVGYLPILDCYIFS